ncbi:hypothetical protein HanIR_Chr08g0380391 [Helianthus annuus]|nr:hypothetical protein HanIR_Chr08g0380391 [Helianthus annuus]
MVPIPSSLADVFIHSSFLNESLLMDSNFCKRSLHMFSEGVL